ncbi:MAG: heparinase II/III family protein [bacterium]|nr:heparinase II/III family protein [bacterium]
MTTEPSVSQIARPYWPDGDVRSAIFCARYPDSLELIAKARETSRGLITFWHPWHMEKTWVPEQLESPIDWDKIRTGDEEWPHALARLSHLVDLAAGWRLTNEQPLADCYWDHVEQFCSARRGTQSHLWSNRLDSALRIFHLIKSFDILRNGDVSTASQSKLLFDHLRFEVDFLLQGLGSKVGNWELIICCAILTASEYLHGLVDTTIWREKASSRLQELLKTEIQPDGHWIEQAPMYHGECIIALTDYVVILRTNDLPIPDWLLQAVQTLLVTLEEITDPQGKIPQIGDSDAFETAYISNLCETLLGEQARAKKTASARPLVKIYQPTGWAVSKWNDPATGKKYQLLFDASGKPPVRRQWHSHADDLQVILTSSDGPILVDPGRFTYSPVLGPSNPTLRKMIQSSGLFRRLYGMFVPQNRELTGTDWRDYFFRTAGPQYGDLPFALNFRIRGIPW